MVCEFSRPMDGQIYNIGPNPCFNGIWSARASAGASYAPTEGVLILVLMEYGLRVYPVGSFCRRSIYVLILVLMEYGLRE